MISNTEWASISRMIESEVGRLIGRRRDYFFLSKVIKNDVVNKLVWVAELGPEQPIPLFVFNYKVTYFDESPKGASGGFHTHKKTATVEIEVPKKGQIVLVAREWGSDQLPRCLGVLRSKNFIGDMEDT